MTISPEATDSTGAKVFRTADECNAYRFAYPEDFVVGWQCVNTGGKLGVNRCVSVTQYTTNDRQPLFASAGTCLAKCEAPAAPMAPKGTTAPMAPKAPEGAPKGTTAPISEGTMAPKGTTAQGTKAPNHKNTFLWVSVAVIIAAIVFLLICVLIWKNNTEIRLDGGA
jgi:hypothetical protein